MNPVDILNKMGGTESIAKQLGVTPTAAEQGAVALLPSILDGFRSKGTDGALGGLIGQLGGAGLLASVLGAGPTPVGQGNDILGQIFGSKDVSRQVAGDAAANTGLDRGLLQQMLPMLTMMVAGYMAKQGGIAGQGQSAAPNVGASGGAGGLLGGIGKMLDRNGEGNPLDDLMGMASKFRK